MISPFMMKWSSPFKQNGGFMMVTDSDSFHIYPRTSMTRDDYYGVVASLGRPVNRLFNWISCSSFGLLEKSVSQTPVVDPDLSH